MAKWRCSLCGGRLSEGRCTLCGLDNTIYKREIAYSEGSSQEESRQEQKQHIKAQSQKQTRRPEQHGRKETSDAGKYSAAAASAGGSGYGTGPAGQRSTAASAQHTKQKSRGAGRVHSANNNKTRSGRPAVIAILLIILFSFLPAIIEAVQSAIQDVSSDSGSVFDTYFSDSYDEEGSDYDPYWYVTREIPDTGEAFEIVLGNGIYKVGVHIPEGVYRAEVVEGGGSVGITDDENLIYDSVYLGEEEEYGQVPDADDLRFYNGAELQVGDGVIVKLSTENAQPLVQETSENPLTESVSLPEGTCISGDGTVPQGIYDLTVDTSYEGGYGYSSITLLYPNGQSEYFWADGPDSAVTSSQYTDISVKNIVIPEGTEISVEYGGVILTPAEGYYDVDYSGYEGG